MSENDTLCPDSADSAQECPFPGIASYNYEGRNSFFGRDEEAAALGALILSRRLTILTAGSGDGKTSLLHAAIAPFLLHEGIEVVIAEPGGRSPIDEFARYCLRRLTIDPNDTVPVLEALARKLGGAATLAGAREHSRCISAQERHELLKIDKAKTQRPINQLGDSPLVSWLRDPKIPNRYIAACGVTTVEGSIDSSWLSPERSLEDAIEALKGIRPSNETVVETTLENLAVRLLQQIENAVRRRKRADDDFELVVILDQFEELFTQFEAGNGPVTNDVAQKRQHRGASFIFVREFLKWRWPATVRLVLSLRKEHYADLQAELEVVDDFGASTYHLAALTKEQAKQCMDQPKHWPGGVLNDDQIQTVVDVISEDGEFVVPIVLSVVGAWLWHKRDRTSMTVDEIRSLLETGDEESLGNPLDQFVARVFDEPDGEGRTWDSLEKQEALDILEQLIIRNGDFARKAQIDEEALINVPNRRLAVRQNILDGLVNRKLVRRERRRGEYYVEIVHEKLINSFGRKQEILKASSEEHYYVARLTELLDELRTGLPSDALSRDLLRIFAANIRRIELSPGVSAVAVRRLLKTTNDELGSESLRDQAEFGSSTLLENSDRTRVIWHKIIGALPSWTTVEQSFGPDMMVDVLRRRIKRDRRVSPAAADYLRNDEQTLEDPKALRCILVSSLGHRDAGARDRIRTFGNALREVT